MTDFLDHLIGRADFRAEDVQPRPVSRFEPSPAAWGATGPPDGETEREPTARLVVAGDATRDAAPVALRVPRAAGTDSLAPDPVRTGRAPAAVVGSHAVPATREAAAPMPARTTADAGAVEARSQASGRAREPARPDETRNRRGDARPRAPEASSSVPDPRPAFERPPPVVPSLAPQHDAPRPAPRVLIRPAVVVAGVELQAAPHPAAQRPQATEFSRGADPSPFPLRPSRAEPTAAAGVGAAPSPAAEPAARLPAQAVLRPPFDPIGGPHRYDGPAPGAHATPPAPTIQVTIGRVEVRASVAPHQPKRPARPQPQVMSLDEYLKQRASGGRG